LKRFYALFLKEGAKKQIPPAPFVEGGANPRCFYPFGAQEIVKNITATQHDRLNPSQPPLITPCGA